MQTLRQSSYWWKNPQKSTEDNPVADKRQEQTIRCGTDASTCITSERIGEGAQSPRHTYKLTTSVGGPMPPSMCAMYNQTWKFLQIKKKRSNGSALEEEGGEVGPCCVTLENHFTSLSLISFSKVEIIINVAVKCGLWWWPKERLWNHLYKAVEFVIWSPVPCQFTHSKPRGNYKVIAKESLWLNLISLI